MLINGILFTYLLFTGQLSGADNRGGGQHTLTGLSVLGIFAILIAVFYISGYAEAVRYLLWGAIVITSAALLIRLFQIWR